MPIDEHRQANLDNWNDRVPIHVDGYEVAEYVTNRDKLSRIVKFDRRYLGEVSGRTLLHLQCHIGTDTISWAKLGATVTGVDFSAPALDVARDLASRLELDATFVEAELYDAPNVLSGTFDIVYTGVGAINWLPDIKGWAEVVAGYVKQGGVFYTREGHPMFYTLDQERGDDLLVVTEPYFERAEPNRWEEPGTYLGEGTVEHQVTYEWNHGLGEVINALIGAGLVIDMVEEHRFLDWLAVPSMIETDEGFVLPDGQRDLVPLMYSIMASKPPAAD